MIRLIHRIWLAFNGDGRERATLGVFLQVLVTENSRLVALFQTAALSGTEWRELLFLAAAPLAAHELLAGLSRISGARGTAGKEWTGS